MEYNIYRQKLNEIIDQHKKVLFTKENREKHYWLDKDKIEKNKAFEMMDDILTRFKENNPEVYYNIGSNYYQYNCMFIDIVIDDFGQICNFWGYGIDERLGKCRKWFVFNDVVNQFSKENIQNMGYEKTSVNDLRTELEKLIAENMKATEGNKRNTTYEILIESLGYDEGIIQDMEDFGLFDNENN